MYRVELSKRAFKSLERLDSEVRCRVLEKLAALREEPIPRGAIKLRGEKDAYRLRIGDYRILYKVLWEERVVLVFKVEHRRRAYRRS
ncbi:MAG: type II toxin-antitoxin system RelE/ParE family toxin [Thermoproteota archaeon]|nr:MAG: type II toxin-antitoxin system RelE/ParE family toxin [Candidatus Korarchaeota archaeon]